VSNVSDNETKHFAKSEINLQKDEVVMAKTILVVDDEMRLVSVVEAYLEQEGYKVVKASNGREALFAARQEKPDLIILDIMMPEMDGFEFMRLHRKERETPIILLTAKVEDDDKVIGLELGADDYLTKPFRPRELIARVRAVLRRTGITEPKAQVLREGNITLDRESHFVKVGDDFVDLTPSEFDLLAALLSSPGRAYSRLDLLDRLQGTAFEGYERTIDVHVKNLRAKIEQDPRNPHYIETVYGVGYRLRRE
jgi:DNA-binding response OmpR family regulator